MFYVENQSVVQWGVKLEPGCPEDPPVVVADENGKPEEWITENETTSEFAIQMFLFSIKWSEKNPGWASGSLTPPALDVI